MQPGNVLAHHRRDSRRFRLVTGRIQSLGFAQLVLHVAYGGPSFAASGTVTPDASIEYDRVLLQIDFIHGDLIPAISPVAVTDRDVLFTVAESAIEDLATHGIDGLTVELVLDMLYGARELDAP